MGVGRAHERRSLRGPGAPAHPGRARGIPLALLGSAVGRGHLAFGPAAGARPPACTRGGGPAAGMRMMIMTRCRGGAAAEAVRLPRRCGSRGGAARAPPQPRHCRRCVRAPDAVVPCRGRLCPSARTRAYSAWARHAKLFVQHAVDAPAAPNGGAASRARVRLAAPPLDSDRFFAVLEPWLGHFAICSALAHATLIN